MKPLDIAVVGAGISGLTAVIALAKKGHRVRLFEAAPAWADIGAGITLAPNAMRGMDYIDVGKTIADTGIEPSKQHISHWQTNALLVEVDREGTADKYGAAYVYIHRADLHSILVAEAEKQGVEIYLGKHIEDVDFSSEKPKMAFSDGTSGDADLVIGADGLKSQTRQLFAPESPNFSGHIAFRAIAPVTPKIQHLLDQPGMHIGPGKMVVRYPLRKGKLINLVFFAREDGWTEEGWSIPAEIDELKRLYSGWCDDIQLLINAIEPGTVFKWAINQHKPLKTWNRENKIVLVGDAAHAMTPFMGQGAATGIEDAIMLSRAIDDSSNLADAISRYEKARIERTSYIQHESNVNADRLEGDESELYGLGNLVNEETLGLFSYDCVAETV